MNDKKLDVYSASAGSGKTYTLSRKYIYILLKKSLIEKNTAPSLHKHILAVTFTNKATTEMKERIVRDLHLLSLGQHQAFCADLCNEFMQEGESVGPAQIQERSGKLLRDILHDYSNFSVSTIDMFFQKLLRGFLKEIGIQPDFQIELDDAKLIRQATDLLLERIDRSILGDANALRAYSEDMLATGKWNLRQKLSDNAEEVLASHYRKNYLHKEENFRALEEFQSALRKQQTAWKGRLDELGKQSRRILQENCIEKTDFKYGDKGTLFKFLTTLTSSNYDSFDFEKAYMVLGLECSDSAECGSKNASTAYHTYFPQLQTLAREARDLCLLLTESDHFSRNLALMKVFHLIGNHINLLQQEENLRRLGDAQDLIEHILRENSIPFLYEKAGLRYHHLLLDEFQDTSEGQWNCLSPLLEESLASDNACLIVGDVKQSIYRWRDGDWRILGQEVRNKFGEQTHWHTLNKNWRSDAKVVEFNNLLFGSFPKTLAQNFGAPSSFEKVFSDVVQEVRNPDSGGYVEVHFSDSLDYTLENLGPLIADLIARGYKCSDIAVLVRSKKVAKEAAQAILDYNSLHPELRLEIVSQESLTMESAASVQWMLAMLRLASIPEKERKDANHLHHHEAIAALSRVSPEQGPEAWREKAFSGDKPLLKLASEIEHKGLLWAMEALTRWLCEISPEKKLRDAAFIQSFHNLVNGYCKNGNNSPAEFLEMWDDVKEHYIQTPPGKNAVNIMTIHKSKGLEFPVVIVPTDQFSLKKKNDPKVWTYPEQLRSDAVEKYKEFQLSIPRTPLLISWKESLRKGIFEKLYWEESELEWLEMLNLLYVALTRAENELYVFSTLKKLEEPTESELKSEIGANLYAHFRLGKMDQCALEHLPSGALRYTLGKPKDKTQKSSVDTDDPQPIPYQSYQREIALKIHPYAKRHPSEDEITASPRSYGILMHRLLETIELPEDLEILSKDERFFDVPRSDLLSCIEKLQKALCDPLAASWFSKSWEVYKEAEILLPDSEKGKKSLRPDRVMIREDEIVIVDYKFGDKAMESERKHREQILNYQAQLSAMGQSNTKIKLYLWYIDCDTLLAVT